MESGKSGMVLGQKYHINYSIVSVPNLSTLSIGIILSHFSIISGRRPAGNTITITITSPLSGVFCPKPKRVNKLEDLIIAKLLTHPSVSQKQKIKRNPY